MEEEVIRVEVRGRVLRDRIRERENMEERGQERRRATFNEKLGERKGNAIARSPFFFSTVAVLFRFALLLSLAPRCSSPRFFFEDRR